MKKNLQDKVVDVFEEQFPHLKGAADVIISGSPLSYNFYIGSSRGEIYGLSHNTNRFSPKFSWLLRPTQHEIKGLYLTGTDITCCGVAGALSSAFLTALAFDYTVALDIVYSFIANL